MRRKKITESTTPAACWSVDQVALLLWLHHWLDGPLKQACSDSSCTTAFGSDFASE